MTPPLARGQRVRRWLTTLAGAGTVGLVVAGCSIPVGIQGTGGQSFPGSEQPEATLEGYYGQEIPWSSVDCYPGAECAKVFAPLNWADPAGEAIELALVRQPAIGGAPQGTLFVNPGGPGASGASFVGESVEYAVTPEVRSEYDVVGWDPRGVGASSAVRCLDDTEMDDYLFGIAEPLEQGSPEWVRAVDESVAEFGARCIENTGELLGYVDTKSTVRDLDMLRALVGEERLSYLGFSYGSLLGAYYAEEFPDRVGRLVLDGAIDPASTLNDMIKGQTLGFERAARAYMADCLDGGSCPFTGSVDDGMAELGQLLAQVEADPIPAADGRELGLSTLLTAIQFPLYNELSWPALTQMLEGVQAGNVGMAFRLADQYYDRGEDGSYEDNSTVAFMAINCLDYDRGADMAIMREQAEELAQLSPTFGPYQGYGEQSCVAWPIPSEMKRGPVSAPGAAPILVVGTTGDPATPYEWAVNLSEQLESATLVTFEGEGHTAYNSGANACVRAAVDQYLLEGKVPASDPRC